MDGGAAAEDRGATAGVGALARVWKLRHLLRCGFLDLTAPAGQVARLRRMCQPQGGLRRPSGLAPDQPLRHARAEEISPKEFDEWRLILGIAAGASHDAGQTAIWIILQVLQ